MTDTIGKLTETIKIESSSGFNYEVELHHRPHFGYTNAQYKNGIIAQVELGRMRLIQPDGDDDKEWEEYEERLAEWTDEIKVNIIPKCKEWFDRSEQHKSSLL